MFRRFIQGSLAALGILVCILDSRTALEGAWNGIDLCLHSIVPSLLPFMVLSGILTSSFLGTKMRIFRPLGRLIGIPKGMEGIFLTGLIGGYPIGAQTIYQAWQQGQLNEKDARRMLAFCSNAGPSFLFGILGTQFSKSSTIWLLWGIHILSAIAVGALLPGKSKCDQYLPKVAPLTLTKALKKSVMTMGYICGWVILFRVLIAFLNRWVLRMLPVSAQVLVYGLIELANGCCSVSQISSEGMKFVISGVMLAFGGVCVYLQTVSVTEKLGTGQYLLGKTMHTLLSLIACLITQYFIFVQAERIQISPLWMLIPVCICILLLRFHRKVEKKSSIPAVVGV